MAGLNHSRLRHRGNACEPALHYTSAKKAKTFVAAKPANAGRVLSLEEKAALAAKLGLSVAA